MNIYPRKELVSGQWYHTDSLDLFQKNITRLPAAWAARSWPVNYEFNSTAHRSPEWTEVTWPTYMAVFGSSSAMGVGLELSETWGHKIADQLSLQLVNVAEVDSSLDSCVDRAVALIHHAPTPPKLIIIDWPSLWHQRYYYQGSWVTMTGSEPSSLAEHHWWFTYSRTRAEVDHMVQQFRFYQRIIEGLCHRANIALWQFTSDSSYAGLCDDLAQPRILHPGLDKSIAAHLEFLARDVELIKTTKEQRRKGWGDHRPQAHPGLYHQQRVVDAYWAAGIEIKY